jgi:hypothetical protein
MNTIENLNELFYGKEAAEKIEKFKNGMLEIEKRHLDYFEQRPKKFTHDKSDRLHNHYVTQTNNNGMSFNFIKDSDLEQYIRNECIEMFNRIFNSK